MFYEKGHRYAMAVNRTMKNCLTYARTHAGAE
jgi:hypothetical protein